MKNIQSYIATSRHITDHCPTVSLIIHTLRMTVTTSCHLFSILRYGGPPQLKSAQGLNSTRCTNCRRKRAYPLSILQFVPLSITNKPACFRHNVINIMMQCALENTFVITFNILEHNLTLKRNFNSVCHCRVNSIYTVWVKKQHTLLLPITSPNVERFSKFFHLQKRAMK